MSSNMENKGHMCVYLPAIWPWDQSQVVCRAYCTCCIWIIQHARPSILTNIRAGKNMYRLLRIHVQKKHCSKQSLEILRITYVQPFFLSPLSLSPSPRLSHIHITPNRLATKMNTQPVTHVDLPDFAARFEGYWVDLNHIHSHRSPLQQGRKCPGKVETSGLPMCGLYQPFSENVCLS